MHRRMILIVAGVAAAALAVGGVAWATSGGSSVSLPGNAKAKAGDAALAHTGGGTVIETETGDNGAAYSVEIRRADGSTVEVSLDKSFAVTGQEGDDDGAKDDQSGANDD